MQDTTQKPNTAQTAYSPRIRAVDSIAAMCREDFAGDENVLLVPRRLSGAFNALAMRLSNIDYKSREEFLKSCTAAPRLHPVFGAAAAQVLDDMNALRENGFRPELRLVKRRYYTPSVMNYHVDRGDSRIICCYNGQATEFLNNEDARHQHAARSTGAFYAKEGAVVQTFQLGDIWRHKGVKLDRSGEHGVREEMAAAFIHRAPKMAFVSFPRMMVVGE